MEHSGTFKGFRSRRSIDRDAMHVRSAHSGASAGASGAERVRNGSWDGSEGEAGEDRGLRDPLNTIEEERAASESSLGAHPCCACY